MCSVGVALCLVNTNNKCLPAAPSSDDIACTDYIVLYLSLEGVASWWEARETPPEHDMHVVASEVGKGANIAHRKLSPSSL